MDSVLADVGRGIQSVHRSLNKSFFLAATCLTLLSVGNANAVHARGERSLNHLFTNTSTQQKNHLDFIKNNGQWRPEVKYRAAVQGGALFLTNKGFVYNFTNEADFVKIDSLMDAGVSREVIGDMPIHQYAYKVNFVGANISNDFEPKIKRSYYNNYIIGRDKSKWQGFVPLYGMVTQKSIYQGVDLVVYSKDNAPKYDFMVAPGVNPDVIQLEFEGIKPELTKDGNIKLKTTFNEIQENAPVAYQTINGQNIDVPVRYVLNKNKISFEFPNGYNTSYPLVVDPQLVFCTYTGFTGSGSGPYAYSTTYDADGNTYVGAEGWEMGWPVTMGAFQSTFSGAVDVAINKYNPLGTNLIYSTYYGGSGQDYPNTVRVNSQGELYVAGGTNSSNLPVTVGCADSTLGGSMDIYVAHLNATGSQLIGATYIGGSAAEPIVFTKTASTSSLQGTLTPCPVDINFDTLGNVWVVSNTSATDFPVTANAQQSIFNGGASDGVLVKLPPNCSQYLYSSFIGGSATDGVYGIDFMSNQDMVICGFTTSIDFPTTDSVIHPGFLGGQLDGFVSILNPNTGAIKKSTYLGTTTQDFALQVVVDDYDNIYVMGICSGDYPTSPNVYSVPFGNTFVDELSSDLSSSLASTVVGGSNYYPDGFQVDICGNIYVTGLGAPSGLPLTQDAYQTVAAPFWFIVLKPHFSGLLYATYFGASSDHNHCSISRIDPNGIVYHSICNSQQYADTTAHAFQTHHGSGGQDVITLKFDFQATGVQSHIDAASGGDDTTGCAPFTLHLGNSSTSPYGITYSWDAGDNTPTTSGTDFNHTYNDPGTYKVVLHAHSDSACIQDDFDSFTVHVVKVTPPSITTSEDTLLCNLETSLPLWVHIDNPTVNNTIQWWPANGVFTGGTTDTAIVNPAINTYYVKVTDSIAGLCGFSTVDTVHIDFYPRNLTIHTNDTTVCKGTQVQVDAEAAQGYSFVWSPINGLNDTTVINPIITANQSMTYTLTAHHPGCMDTAQTLTINVQDYPVVDLGSDMEYCEWSDVPLSANVTPYRNDYTYQWLPASVGMNFPNSPNAHVTADTSGWYYLTVTAPVGCSGKDSVHLTVFPGNFGAVSADTGYCLPNEVQLWAAGASHYTWTPAFGLSDTAIANPVAKPTSTTNYTVYMEDVHGCKDTGSVLVAVYPSATLSLPDSITVYPGEAYHLEPATNCVYFDWFPTSGVNSTTVADPVFSPSVRTRYFVTGKTENGCVVTDSLDVLVKNTAINMPNAFTPGVGVNGTYKVAKRGIASLKEFAVYNRWGNKVFSTTDINQGWDGNFKGKPQPTGVYIYIIEAVTNSGQSVIWRGNVTLIR